MPPKQQASPAPTPRSAQAGGAQVVTCAWAQTPSRLCAPTHCTKLQHEPALPRGLQHVGVVRDLTPQLSNPEAVSARAPASEKDKPEKQQQQAAASSVRFVSPACRPVTSAAFAKLSMNEVISGILDVVAVVRDLGATRGLALLSLTNAQIAVASPFHHRPSPRGTRWVVHDLATAVDGVTAAPHASAQAVARWLVEDVLPHLDSAHWAEIGVKLTAHAAAGVASTSSLWAALSHRHGVRLLDVDAVAVAEWADRVLQIRVPAPAQGPASGANSPGAAPRAPPSQLSSPKRSDAAPAPALPDPQPAQMVDATAQQPADENASGGESPVADEPTAAEATRDADVEPSNEAQAQEGENEAAAGEAEAAGPAAEPAADGESASAEGATTPASEQQETHADPHADIAEASAGDSVATPPVADAASNEGGDVDAGDSPRGAGMAPLEVPADSFTLPTSGDLLEELCAALRELLPAASLPAIADAALELAATREPQPVAQRVAELLRDFIDNGLERVAVSSGDVVSAASGSSSPSRGIQRAGSSDAAGDEKQQPAEDAAAAAEAPAPSTAAAASSTHIVGGALSETLASRLDGALRRAVLPWLLEPAMLVDAERAVVVFLRRVESLSAVTRGLVARYLGRLFSAPAFGARDATVRRGLLRAVVQGVGFQRSALAMLLGTTALSALESTQAVLPSSFTIQFLAFEAAAAASTLLKLPVLVQGPVTDVAAALKEGWIPALSHDGTATCDAATAAIDLAALHVVLLRVALLPVLARGAQLACRQHEAEQQKAGGKGRSSPADENAASGSNNSGTRPRADSMSNPDVVRARKAALRRMQGVVCDGVLPWVCAVLQHCKPLLNAASKFAKTAGDAADAPIPPAAAAHFTESFATAAAAMATPARARGMSTTSAPDTTDGDAQAPQAAAGASNTDTAAHSERPDAPGPVTRAAALHTAIGRLLLALASVVVDAVSPLGLLGLCPPEHRVREQALAALCTALTVPVPPRSRVAVLQRLEALCGTVPEFARRATAAVNAASSTDDVADATNGDAADAPSAASLDAMSQEQPELEPLLACARAVATKRGVSDGGAFLRELLPLVTTLASVPSDQVRAGASRLSRLMLADLHAFAAAAGTKHVSPDGPVEPVAVTPSPKPIGAVSLAVECRPTSLKTPWEEACATSALVDAAAADVGRQRTGADAGSKAAAAAMNVNGPRALDGEEARQRLWVLCYGGAVSTPAGELTAGPGLVARAAKKKAEKILSFIRGNSSGSSGAGNGAGSDGESPLPSGAPLHFAPATDASVLLPWPTD